VRLMQPSEVVYKILSLALQTVNIINIALERPKQIQPKIPHRDTTPLPLTRKTLPI
jgi:hypothetical protein